MANKRGNITGIGNLTGLRPVTNTTAATTDTMIVDYEADEEDNDGGYCHSFSLLEDYENLIQYLWENKRS